jgi:trimethylamine:corrinoid methyltransferase-like protein
VGASNDVSGDQAITNALAGISAGANGSVHSAGFATDENGHITAAHEFTADQAHFGSLGHGVSGLDRGDQTPGLDHAEGDAHGFVSHYLLLEEGWNVRQQPCSAVDPPVKPFGAL